MTDSMAATRSAIACSDAAGIVRAAAEKNCGWVSRSWSKVVFMASAFGEEIEHDLQFAGALHRRQALPDLAAIGLGDQPRVADHQHALVVLVADQAAGALLDVDDGARQLVLDEGVAAFALHLLDTGRQHRVVGRGKGNLVDDDQRQRFAADIHTLPEALTANQDGRAVVAKALQEVVLAPL